MARLSERKREQLDHLFRLGTVTIAHAAQLVGCSVQAASRYHDQVSSADTKAQARNRVRLREVLLAENVRLALSLADLQARKRGLEQDLETASRQIAAVQTVLDVYGFAGEAAALGTLAAAFRDGMPTRALLAQLDELEPGAWSAERIGRAVRSMGVARPDRWSEAQAEAEFYQEGRGHGPWGIVSRPEPGQAAGGQVAHPAPSGDKAWTDDRTALLIEEWPRSLDTGEIIAKLNRLPGPPVTASSVQAKATRLKLRRPADQRARMATAQWERHRAEAGPTPLAGAATPAASADDATGSEREAPPRDAPECGPPGTPQASGKEQASGRELVPAPLPPAPPAVQPDLSALAAPGPTPSSVVSGMPAGSTARTMPTPAPRPPVSAPAASRAAPQHAWRSSRVVQPGPTEEELKEFYSRRSATKCPPVIAAETMAVVQLTPEQRQQMIEHESMMQQMQEGRRRRW